jgi:hypothetical protein
VRLSSNPSITTTKKKYPGTKRLLKINYTKVFIVVISILACIVLGSTSPPHTLLVFHHPLYSFLVGFIVPLS